MICKLATSATPSSTFESGSFIGMGDAKTYEKLMSMAINEENDPIVVS